MAHHFGTLLTFSNFGESHGKAIGGIVSGVPAGVKIDVAFIQHELQRRKTALDPNSTERKEEDSIEFLSGIYKGESTGSPIGFVIPNLDVQIDNEHLRVIKPSHASYVYKQKYGHEDNYPVGRASARLTACWVVAGAIAKLLLRPFHVTFETQLIESGVATCAEDTVGAKIGCSIQNLPIGLGEPLFDKFDARLAFAMLSLNGVKGFEIGKGFEASKMGGIAYIDRQTEDFRYLSNHDGGVQGGITNGEELYFSVAFKPIPAVKIPTETVDFNGKSTIYKANNRNDRCVAPRVFPVIEAAAALVIADFILQSPYSKIYEKKITEY